jgi:SAM-dependent methyltransferase
MQDYRESHSGEGYGKVYTKTYEAGFYSAQWSLLEKPLIKAIFQKIANQNKTKYLDFACGTGRIIKLAENYFNETWGVDVSDSMLEISKSNCNSSTLLNQDITSNRINKKFDVITAFRFFLNAQKQLRLNVLTEMHAMMNKNGYLIINVHVNANSPLGWVYRIRNKVRKKTIANTMSLECISKELNDSGFDIEEVHFYSYYPRTGPWFGALATKLILPIEKICRFIRVPRNFAQSFIVISRPI